MLLSGVKAGTQREAGGAFVVSPLLRNMRIGGKFLSCSENLIFFFSLTGNYWRKMTIQFIFYRCPHGFIENRL